MNDLVETLNLTPIIGQSAKFHNGDFESIYSKLDAGRDYNVNNGGERSGQFRCLAVQIL